MHGLLDVAFKNGLARYRRGHGAKTKTKTKAKTMAIVRRFVLALGAPTKPRKRQNKKKSSRLEHRLPPQCPSTQMRVNLESLAWGFHAIQTHWLAHSQW
ncbi:MAG: hypothetical protein M3Z96_02875 [Pseudomonadota bacterium]|nr:hypothetical protein [Pseudomonadota bacterium]